MKPLALVPVSASALAVSSPSRRLVDAFLSGRNPRTLQAYRQDLADFRAFTADATAEEAAARLLSQAPGDANGLVLDYKASLLERRLSPATVNRRLAALRSLVKLARTLGFVSWSLEVESVKAQAYRDTRGPGRIGFERERIGGDNLPPGPVANIDGLAQTGLRVPDHDVGSSASLDPRRRQENRQEEDRSHSGKR